jgi:hypothetical protein
MELRAMAGSPFRTMIHPRVKFLRPRVITPNISPEGTFGVSPQFIRGWVMSVVSEFGIPPENDANLERFLLELLNWESDL